MRVIRKIDRRHRDPVVRDRKVKLHAECGPGAAIANLRLLDGWIGIEHGLAADLVDAGIDMAADIRQHRAFQIFVLEKNGAPVVRRLHTGQVRPERVGIVEA